MSETESKPTLAELQRSAHEFLKKERWEPAYEVLMRASEQYPDSADVFSDLAAAERALGHLEQAILHYQRALELDPKLAFVHNNLGNALSDKGLNRDAIDCFHRALVLQPRYPAALNNLANVLLREGRMEDAKRALERLFNLTRDFQPAFETVALLCEKQGDVQGAMNHYVSLAGHYLAARKPEKSLWAMEACRRLGHRSAGLEANRSAAFLQLSRFEDARDAGIAALRLDPNHANAHVNLATAYMALRDQPNAIALLRRAVELNPGLIEAYINLGSALSEVGDYHGALAAQHRALELDPNNPRAMSGLALGYQMLKRRDEALELYRRAIALAPSFAETHVRYGAALLAVGQYQEGFREYDWRRYETIPRKTQELYTDSNWAGQPLEGKTIVLYWEQSLGDSLQFIRYAQLLKERGATVVVDCQPTLQRLLAAQNYVDRLATQDSGGTKPTWDYSASIVSLPHLFGTTLDTVPAPAAYITAPSGSPHPTLANAQGLKVGLVWAGSPAYRNDRKRSIDLSAFEPLAAVPGISWFSLQVGPPSARLQQPTHLAIQDLGSTLTDWVDTAQLIQQLDLVITVDTAVAHLAGAMGKPVWVLVPDAADWRWLLGRDDSPWYPSLRLFRQEQADAWEPVIARVGSKLVELTHTTRPQSAVEPTT
jgi:tetratricopeptide (TPR) repeat protein